MHQGSLAPPGPTARCYLGAPGTSAAGCTSGTCNPLSWSSLLSWLQLLCTHGWMVHCGAGRQAGGGGRAGRSKWTAGPSYRSEQQAAQHWSAATRRPACGAAMGAEKATLRPSGGSVLAACRERPSCASQACLLPNPCLLTYPMPCPFSKPSTSTPARPPACTPLLSLDQPARPAQVDQPCLPAAPGQCR